MAKQAPRFIVQPGWKLRFAAELTPATADIVGVLGRALQ
jgi:hypothetical protein